MQAVSLGREPFPSSSAWRGEARALLERAIARHGGWGAWQALGGIALVPASLGGMLPAAKGLGRTFSLPSRIEVWPRQAVAVFHDYPSRARRGVFTAGRVELLDGDGCVLVRRDDARRSFRGWRKYRRWSPLDALYFFGYALAHYHGLPFTLVDGRPLRLRQAALGGRRLQGVTVALPPDLHTHSPTQAFFFDEDGLLRRHDYVAEVAGRWARGAHLWEDFVEVSGVPVARRRRVLARLGGLVLPFLALRADLEVTGEALPAAAPITPA